MATNAEHGEQNLLFSFFLFMKMRSQISLVHLILYYLITERRNTIWLSLCCIVCLVYTPLLFKARAQLWSITVSILLQLCNGPFFSFSLLSKTRLFIMTVMPHPRVACQQHMEYICPSMNNISSSWLWSLYLNDMIGYGNFE